MKIGYVFTNYNNSHYTKAVIDSIMSSAVEYDKAVVIVDNASEPEDIASLKGMRQLYPDVTFIFNDENVGYFPGLNVGVDYLKSTCNPDCIVVGNNDLVFPGDFYEKVLRREKLFDKHPVISPSLITLDGVYQNPHVIKGISPVREFIWDIYYWNYYAALLIQKIAAVTKKISQRKDHYQNEKAQLIYQGYGACYILGPKYLNEFNELWAPTFLMGEELFLTKQLEKQGYGIFYEPSLEIEHHDHATVSKLPTRKLWEISKESHSVYRKHVGHFSSKLKKGLRNG